MGRKPMSPELKEARGNPGKRPVQKKSPTPVMKRVALVRPAWLTDKFAKAVWDQLQGSLHFLRQSDVNVFARYCVYLANWVDANKKIEATGGAVYETSSAHVEGMLRINPWFSVRSRLEDDLVKIEEKVGLTPLDRQKIIVSMASAAGGRSIGDLFGGGAGAGDEPEAPVPGEVAAAPADDMPTVGGLNSRLN
ncbi:MAG: P27 family phage terminase small subunit [Hyphomicrobiales bacterium]|nr:MAG: P27 family phage terminase small subunit [Hyphomicrobiales bacterium]